MHEHYEWCVSIKHLRSIKKVILDTFKKHPAIKYLICHTLTFKGTVHLTIKNARFHCFGVAEFWGHQYRDFCSLSSITGTRSHSQGAKKKKKKTFEKPQQQCLFSEIMTQLLKIIHKSCCEQFYVRSIRRKRAHDSAVNINGVLLG